MLTVSVFGCSLFRSGRPTIVNGNESFGFRVMLATYAPCIGSITLRTLSIAFRPGLALPPLSVCLYLKTCSKDTSIYMGECICRTGVTVLIDSEPTCGECDQFQSECSLIFHSIDTAPSGMRFFSDASHVRLRRFPLWLPGETPQFSYCIAWSREPKTCKTFLYL